MDPAAAAWASCSIPSVAQKVEVYRLSNKFRCGGVGAGTSTGMEALSSACSVVSLSPLIVLLWLSTPQAFQ